MKCEANLTTSEIKNEDRISLKIHSMFCQSPFLQTPILGLHVAWSGIALISSKWFQRDENRNLPSQNFPLYITQRMITCPFAYLNWIIVLESWKMKTTEFKMKTKYQKYKIQFSSYREVQCVIFPDLILIAFVSRFMCTTQAVFSYVVRSGDG